MLCDSKLNLCFVGNMEQHEGQPGVEGQGGWGVGVGQEEEEKEGGDVIYGTSMRGITPPRHPISFQNTTFWCTYQLCKQMGGGIRLT